MKKIAIVGGLGPESTLDYYRGIIVSIVIAARKYAQQQRLKKLLLLGTKFTMQSDFYQQEFNRHGIEIVLPEMDEQNYIHEKLFSEIELGIVKNSTKQGLLRIVERKSTSVEGVILACTELPMIVKDSDMDIAYLDTTQIHISSIVKYCLLEESK